jgi:hypothetical protein
VSRACAASAVHVAIVVDTGSGSSVSALCVPADASENGATLLAARASMLGTPQPRYAPSGLLCAIDGFPATGCGERQPNGSYMYWSYWHGSNGAWSYASIGPASTRVDPAVIEGWRWQDGSQTVDRPPRVAPDATAICKPTPPPVPPTTVAVTTRTTVAATPATAATAPGAGPGPASTASGPVAPQPRARSTGPASTTPTSAPRAGRTGSARRAAAAAHAAARNAPASTSTSIALSATGIAAAAHRSGTGGLPIGFVVGGVLVAALFALGALAARRRRPAA